MISTTRQIVLDTETTGINKLGEHYKGHRIIEIGAVEIINRRLTGRHYHVYIKPNRPVDPEAYRVHGISDQFLINQATFDQIAHEFLEFIRNSELIIHNAMFDIGFIDHEFGMLKKAIPKTETFCKITDSLMMARRLFPGKRNTLDALCSRYEIDSSQRTLHGALLDAGILAKIYLAMTSGQTSINFQTEDGTNKINSSKELKPIIRPEVMMKVIYATDEELSAHETHLNLIEQKGGSCIWRTTRDGGQ